MASEPGVVLAAVVGVGRRQGQGRRILVVGIPRCAHAIRIGKDPASHWNRREEHAGTDAPKSAAQLLCTALLLVNDTDPAPSP